MASLTSRKPFNWSELDRYQLYTMLYSAAPLVLGQCLSLSDLHTILGQHIKLQLPIKISRTNRASVPPGIVCVGGIYYIERDQLGMTQLGILFSYHLHDTSITVTRYQFRCMCSGFADAVLHEIIHMQQWRSREFKDSLSYVSSALLESQRKVQQYYGNTDEMGAFAFNIACELVDRFSDDNRIFEYMQSDASRKHKHTTYFRYMDTFEWDHTHKIIVRIKKMIIKQLKNARNGRPFRTCKYLTS
jgi:hypothetical protein